MKSRNANRSVLNNPDDETFSIVSVVAEALGGSEKAQAELVFRFGPVVTAYFYGKVFDRQEAEDLYQEVFLSVFRNLSKLRDPTRFSPWILRIARSKWVDLIRRKKLADVRFLGELATVNEADPPGVSISVQYRPDTEAQTTEIEEVISCCIGKLGDKYRVIVTLGLIEEMPLTAIAQMLSLKGSTVRMRFKRGLESLRKMLRTQGLDIDFM